MANKKKKPKIKKKVKRRKKRDSTKYPGLNKNLFSKIKQEYFDFDYLDKLNDKEKAWMSQFNEEYLGARLNGNKKPLHKTQVLKKNCFDMNNARNRDITSNAIAGGRMSYDINLKQEVESKQTVVPSEVEDALIEAIDLKNSQSLKGS